jgi:lipid-A-disaccharide synthase
VVLIAADKRFIPYLEKKTKAYPWVHLLENSDGPLRDVDAALIKSGTAVLEAALLGVPTTSMYILSPALAWIVQHIFQFRRGFVTLPNLILDRAIVSERLQAAATPQALADDVDILLTNPRAQEADFEELRACLGGADTLDRWAQCLLAKL